MKCDAGHIFRSTCGRAINLTQRGCNIVCRLRGIQFDLIASLDRAAMALIGRGFRAPVSFEKTVISTYNCENNEESGLTMPATRTYLRTGIFSALFAALLLLTGCGLGMTDEERLARGQQAFLTGEHRAAIIDAKRVLQEQPSNVEARLLLARSSLIVGDIRTAEVELRRALDLGAPRDEVVVDLTRSLLLQGKLEEAVAESDMLPESDDVRRSLYLVRGDVLIGLRRPEEARAAFAAVLSTSDTHPDALLGVARSYLVENNLLQARQTLDEVLTLNGTHIPSWLVSGSLAVQMQDAGRAESDLTRAVELAQSAGNTDLEVTALHNLSEVLLLRDRVDEVPPLLERLRAIADGDPRTTMTSARLAAANEDWSSAQQQLQEVLRIAPEFRPAQILLGIAHQRNGNLGQAEMYLASAVAADPTDPVAMRLLAETRLEMDNAIEARNAIAPLLDRGEAGPAVVSLAAIASSEVGDFDSAISMLEGGLRTEPGNVALKLQLAFVHLQAGNGEEAREILSALEESDASISPFERESMFVMSALATGNVAEGVELAEQLAATWSDEATSHSLLGVARYRADRPLAARASFMAALELAPDSVGPHYFLARLDEAEGRTDAAADRYVELLENDPTESRWMIALARLAGADGDTQRSIDWLEQANEAAPRDTQPKLLLSRAYSAVGNYDDSAAIAEQGLELDGGIAEFHALIGVAHLNEPDFTAAESSFESALRLAPDEQLYRRQLATAQWRRGNPRSAIATLEATRERTLDDLASAVLLATLRFETGYEADAISLASRLVREHPESAVPLALEAELLARSGDARAAAEAWDRALAIENRAEFAVRSYEQRRDAGLDSPTAPLERYLDERPLDHAVRAYLAQEQLAAGEEGAAATELERILDAEPDNFIAANNLAWTYFEAGDERAVAMARRAYELAPNNASVVDTLGWILVQTGDLEEGTRLLREAVTMSGGKAEIRYHLAAALVAAGDTNQAKIILRTLLADAQEFSSRIEAEELLASL